MNFGDKFWQQILVTNFGDKFWWQILVTNWGDKLGCPFWVTNLGSKFGRRIWATNMSDKFGWRIWVTNFGRRILVTNFESLRWQIVQLPWSLHVVVALHETFGRGKKITSSLKTMKIKSIYLSSRCCSIHRGIYISHRHHRCHDHCISYCCCTELIRYKVVRKF